jgi:hypothetical protein
LQQDSGGEFKGELLGDFDDPFAGRREEGEGRREEPPFKFIVGLMLGDGEPK